MSSLASPTQTGGQYPPVAVRFDPDAARRWLADGAAAECGIDASFTTADLSIAAGLDELLRVLADEAEPQVWALCPPLVRVRLWRTADGGGDSEDGDGDAMITADQRCGEHTLQLTSHHGYDDFLGEVIDSTPLRGIDAAVEALGQVADVVNQDVADTIRAFQHPPRTVDSTDASDLPSPDGATAWATASAAPRVVLVGVSAAFTPDEIEALVITAVEALHGQSEDLSLRQLELTARAYALLHDLNEG